MEATYCNESKISDHLKEAETKLECAGYLVIRHVMGGSRECIALEVFAYTIGDFNKVKSVIGEGYEAVININEQEIIIK